MMDYVEITFKPLDEAGAREIFTWQYPPPYDIYNLATEKVDQELSFFLDQSNDYHGLWDSSGRLVAFCVFGADARVPGGEYLRDALDIGFGLRPDLTGQGKSQPYLKAVLRCAAARWKPAAFRVTIADFNQRARRAWEKLGFQTVETFLRERDQKPFVVMIASAGEAAE